MAAPALSAEQRLADYVTQVGALLWPPPASATIASRRGTGGHGTSGRGTSGRSARLIVLPAAERPKLIVPAGRKASAAAVRRYGEPGSARAKVAAKALAVLLGAGLGPVIGGRLAVTVPAGAEGIETYLAGLVGQPVEISMHVGAARANRKPVLQLLTPAGQTIGFAKIGINPLTASLVRAERAALSQLARRAPAAMTVPAVLGAGQWNGLEVLVLGPLPVWLRRRKLHASQLARAVAELAGMAGTTPVPLEASGYLADLAGRAEQAPAGADQAVLTGSIARLADLAGRVRLDFGCWHGDLTPWNMANTSAGLLVWDWERFGTCVPVGFDALHYWLQARVVDRRADPLLTARQCLAAAPALLEPFGVANTQAKVTALAYLMDLSARYLIDRQAEAGARLGAPDRWLLPAIESGLTEVGNG